MKTNKVSLGNPNAFGDPNHFVEDDTLDRKYNIIYNEIYTKGYNNALDKVLSLLENSFIMNDGELYKKIEKLKKELNN